MNYLKSAYKYKDMLEQVFWEHSNQHGDSEGEGRRAKNFKI